MGLKCLVPIRRNGRPKSFSKKLNQEGDHIRVMIQLSTLPPISGLFLQVPLSCAPPLEWSLFFSIIFIYLSASIPINNHCHLASLLKWILSSTISSESNINYWRYWLRKHKQNAILTICKFVSLQNVGSVTVSVISEVYLNKCPSHNHPPFSC